jgi:hypothetical protein
MTTQRAVELHNQKIFRAAAVAGVPDSQRDVANLELHQVPQIANEPTPIKETVRKLTHIEQLQRRGVLEPHQAAACEWYADAHALGFDTIGCTANYDGGGGGGGIAAFDLCARFKHQMEARENYAWARQFVPKPYRALFDDIIINRATIAGVAAVTFANKRSQAESKARAALQLCANLLHDGIKALLPIDAAPPPVERRSARPAIEQDNAPAPRPTKPVTSAIDLKLDDAVLSGIDVAEIHIAPIEAHMLEREGHADTFRDLPLVVRAGWRCGFMLIPRPAQAIAAA